MIKNLLYFAIFTSAVVVLWIVLTIVHNHYTSTIPPATADSIIPIQPTFDTSVINTLTTRQQISVDLSRQSPLSSRSADSQNLKTLQNALSQNKSSASNSGAESL
jgi:hypothetical protein